MLRGIHHGKNRWFFFIRNRGGKLTEWKTIKSSTRITPQKSLKLKILESKSINYYYAFVLLLYSFLHIYSVLLQEKDTELHGLTWKDHSYVPIVKKGCQRPEILAISYIIGNILIRSSKGIVFLSQRPPSEIKKEIAQGYEKKMERANTKLTLLDMRKFTFLFCISAWI